MRRCKSALLSTLSVLAILTVTTTSYAFGSIKEFGLLKPVGKWKVGTVDGQDGISYCAIVNQFDRETVVAFSRNGDNQGSIALDFRGAFFKPGVDYEVSFRIDDAKAQRFSGRASSESSVVVQLGEDEKFYKALNEEGNLRVTMRELDATFALRKLSPAYIDLLECAGTLHPGPKTAAVPVPKVDKQSLVSGDDQDPEAADKAAEEDQIERQKQKLAALELKHTQRMQEQAALKQAVDLKDKEITQMQVAQKAQTAAKAEDISKQERTLALRVEELQKDRDSLLRQMESAKRSALDNAKAAQSNKAIKANLTAKEAELADALKQQTKKSAEMTSLLSNMQAEYQEKLAAKETERQDLKKKMDEVIAENIPLKSSVEKAVKELAESKAHIATLETDLSSVAKQKQELAARIDAQDMQTKLLQASLSAKEKELTTTKTALSGGSEKLASVQAEMNSLVVDHASVVDRLQAELNEKAAQFEQLKKQYEAQNRTLPVTFKMAADLAAKKEEEQALQKQLAESELQRAAAIENAERAQAELNELRQREEEQLSAAQAERDALKQQIEAMAARKMSLVRKSSSKAPVLTVSDAKALFEGPAARTVQLSQPVGVDVDNMAGIEPAAGGNDNSPVPLTSDAGPANAKEFLDRIMSYHRPIGAKTKSDVPANVAVPSVVPVIPESAPMLTGPVGEPPAASSEEKITLEGLLNNSGVAINNFVPVDQADDRVLSRWTAGKISGMYEENAASDNFEGQVKAYIDRYRQDCGDLDVRALSFEQSKAGNLAVADIECKMPSNGYVVSFLFLKDSSGFSTILHTSYQSEKSDVRGIRDAVLRALRKAKGGFAAPQVIGKAMPQQLRLNVRPSVENSPSASSDEQDTVVIQ